MTHEEIVRLISIQILGKSTNSSVIFLTHIIGGCEQLIQDMGICSQCKGKWDGDRGSCMFCKEGRV